MKSRPPVERRSKLPPSASPASRADSRRGTLTFDPAKVKALAAKGLNCKEIGAVVGVDQSTIWRYLDRLKIEAGHVKRYKDNRADVLARMGGRIAGLMEGVAESIEADIDHGVLAACKPEAKLSMLRDLSVVKGILFDKERLERGQSTQNHSLVHKMMGSAFDSAHKDALPEPKTEDSEPKV